ncbi:hypothetical protein C0J52_03477 [Blattella germanica]|nr:hypothetical protein C0J52_03477 [Blattella germanica]
MRQNMWNWKITFIAIVAFNLSDGDDKPCVPREYGARNIVCVCNMTYCDTIQKLPYLAQGEYVKYTTSKAGLRFNKTLGMFNDTFNGKGTQFVVNLTKTFQKIMGFGGAFTDSAGMNIDSLSLETKEHLLRSYFSTDGIEYNFGRNEPVNGLLPVNWFNSMGWTPHSQGLWIKNNFGPALKNYHSRIKLLVIDDQRFMLPWWMNSLMSDEEVASYIDGVAVHWYWDFMFPASLLERTHNNFPDKFILATEACVGDKPWDFEKVKLGSWSRGELYMEDILEDLNHWATGWIDWNLALNPQGGPNWAKNYVDSPIIVNSTANEFYKQPMFYAIGHFSKFLPEDSIRVEMKSNKEGVRSAAFLTPEDMVVIVLYNRWNSNVQVTITDSSTRHITTMLPKRSFTTVVYKRDCSSLS